MPIHRLKVSGYRSLRALDVDLEPVNLIVGPNGSGKTNLYRAVWLLAAAARGGFGRVLADEGGMQSVLWAGPRGKGPVRLRIEVCLEDFRYELACGLPSSSSVVSPCFELDPEIKEERVWQGKSRSGCLMAERAQGVAWMRDEDGRRTRYPLPLVPSESVLSQVQDPAIYPELFVLRREFLEWRFYHHFRTDAESPARQSRVPTYTPVLAEDAHDLTSALVTILAKGDGDALERAIEAVFPGGELLFEPDALSGRLSLAIQTDSLTRPLQVRELSDGALRYLCLAAALLSPQPSPLLALNEPETSLHPDLIEPLADLIVAAAGGSQLWITTHSERLASIVSERTGCRSLRLALDDGATMVPDRRLVADDDEDEPEDSTREPDPDLG